ncbi:MAG TPA: hypothetical protein ENK18_28115 [Deltaproteobacteria bacterium]|nr:hypothetical protein [Deltaproteobacteria bacterium]
MTSYLLLFVSCLSAGILLPMPEDLVLVAAGIQIGAGELSPLLAVGIAAVGVFLRDSVFFTAGRLMGDRAHRHPRARRLLGGERLDRMRALADRGGPGFVLLARSWLGMRTVGMLVAGAVGIDARTFVVWNGVGVLVSVTLVLALGCVAGPAALPLLQQPLAWGVALLVVLGLAGLALFRSLQASPRAGLR